MYSAEQSFFYGFICSYELAEGLDDQMQQISTELAEVIDHVNAVNEAVDPSNAVSGLIFTEKHIYIYIYTIIVLHMALIFIKVDLFHNSVNKKKNIFM